MRNDGIINIYKEKNMTSHDVVGRVRRTLGIRRVGHTGTLDPMAEGVLPVALGRATKDVDKVGDGTKTYEAGMLLGLETDTEDVTGKPVGCIFDKEHKNAEDHEDRPDSELKCSELIEKMESEDSLEKTFDMYKKGVGLLKEANESIDKIEKQVKVLDEDGILS